MKRMYFILAMSLLAVSGFAQLKVDSCGMTMIGQATKMTPDQSPVAKLTIGDDSTYYWGDFSIYNMGFQNCVVPKTNMESIGLYSEVFRKTGMTFPISTGILGLACASSNANFGVAGGLNGSNGAGIFGTTGAGPCFMQLNGSYAGYFDGDTYVDGNLTASAVYSLSDVRLKQDIVSLSEAGSTKGGVLDQLQKVNVIEYNLKAIDHEESSLSKCRHFMTSANPNRTESARRHYGVSAQELQKIYPDLVLEGQNGYLAVNYTELVPLLIRSIQELKAELDKVRQGESDMAISRRMAKRTSSDNSASGNVLYQNTPNPFREQTTIQFSLADEVNDAAICIFDMTGKMLKKLPVLSGESSVRVNGWELGEGMFLYTLMVNGQEIDTKRMILSK